MTFEKFNLSGKTALITGAAGLLGMEQFASWGLTCDRVIKEIQQDIDQMSQNNYGIYGSCTSEKSAVSIAIGQAPMKDALTIAGFIFKFVKGVPKSIVTITHHPSRIINNRWLVVTTIQATIFPPFVNIFFSNYHNCRFISFSM